MSDNHKLTDERLRSWLDANQLGRERLCQAVLSIDGRFSDVQTRQPKGGPDGGRDIEAILDKTHTVWIAVGFKNSANDSKEHRREIEKKFKHDIESAIKANNKLMYFGFMTNISITSSQRERLIKYANKLGMVQCEIFDRERIRVILDSPDGLAFRFQYLAIPLSEAEQSAFFAKWGKSIEQSITNLHEEFQIKTNRIQFILESQKPLRYLSFHLELDDEYIASPPAHFRAACSIILFGRGKKPTAYEVSSCNESPIRASSFSGGAHDCVLCCFRRKYVGISESENDEWQTISTGAGIWPANTSTFIVSGEISQWAALDDAPLLSDLDEAWFLIVVNKRLAEKIQRIKIFANEYIVLNMSREQLSLSPSRQDPDLDWIFSGDELQDSWTRVLGANSNRLNFSDRTPKRFFEPKSSDA